MSEQQQDQGSYTLSSIQLTVILQIVGVITQFFTLITVMRWKIKCGNALCACKPKDSPPSPGSEMTEMHSPAGRDKARTLPNRTVAVVIDEDHPSPPQNSDV